MSQGGAMPSTSPTALVYLNSGDCTIIWQRGDTVAYIFNGNQVKNNPAKTEAIDTFPVSSQGWTDLAAVRLAGENWVKAKRQRCKSCGTYS